MGQSHIQELMVGALTNHSLAFCACSANYDFLVETQEINTSLWHEKEVRYIQE